jgi:acyl carrier protein
MSWTSRLKRSVTVEGRSSGEASDAEARDLPPVEAMDASALSRDEVIGVLRDDLLLLAQERLTADEVDPDGHIFDYGYVDSLSAVIFLARIEERFGVQIEDVELLDTVSSLSAIADRVRQPS